MSARHFALVLVIASACAALALCSCPKPNGGHLAEGEGDGADDGEGEGAAEGEGEGEGVSAIDGVCGPAAGSAVDTVPASGLCSAGAATNVATTGSAFTWSCIGEDGGASASCSAPQIAFGDGVCGPADGVAVTSSPTSGLCSVGAPSSVAGGPQGDGPFTWTCAGVGGGAEASCGADKLVVPVDGACGAADGAAVADTPTSGLCAVGAASPVEGDGPWTWTCAGVDGGLTASCGAQKIVVGDGACGGANGVAVASAPTGGLCSVGIASSVAGSGPFTWTCAGVGGGAEASCSADRLLNPVDGECGVADGAAVDTTPTAGLCAVGAASAVLGSGPWTWTCAGTDGGGDESCGASIVVSGDGVCGAASGVAVASAPTSGLCSVGTSSSVAGSGPFTWTCSGVSGGASASCSAPRQLNPVDGVCGPANGAAVSTTPSAGLCSVGVASSVQGSGPWTWSCAGVDGGADAACNAPIVVSGDGVCGAANGVATTTAPSTGLCDVGSPSAVQGSGPFTWTCSGVNGGNQASCSAPRQANPVNGACGPANNVAVTSAPTSGLCTAGNASSVSGAGPFTWTCAGLDGGNNASCSAPLDASGDTTSAGCGVQGQPTGRLHLSMIVDGTDRDYQVLVPASYDADTPLPLTFVFHGAGAQADDAFFFGLQDAPDPSGGTAAEHSIFVFPQGIEFAPLGVVGWNDFCVGYDTDFYDQIRAQVEAAYCIETAHNFVAGFSWGCDFAVTLASCRGDEIRGIAAASCTDEFANKSDFTTYQNLPSPHATNAALRFTHQVTEDPAYLAPAFSSTSNLLRSFNGCSASSTPVNPSPCVSYSGCAHTTIECSIPNLGHNRPASWAADTWTFFRGL